MEKEEVLAGPQEVAYKDDYITLGQLLKFVRVIDEGGLAKQYLQSNHALVNGVPENRRGRKLREGDVVQLEDRRSYKLVKKQ